MLREVLRGLLDMNLKMNYHKNLVVGIVLLSFFIALQGLVSGVGEITYCAERTDTGAWCQNVPLDKVDQSYRFAPTSCEATSYCNLGTCVNSQEGTCMENTPQRVCEEPIGGVNAGIWFDQDPEEIPQCQLGCCLIGDQASFTTQTRCKQLSSLYGLETDYRTDIGSEIQCIASASPGIEGACVFEKDLVRTCRFTTKSECNDVEASSGGINVNFNAGLLCSNEELGTNCGPSKKTTIVDGRDQVFFIDTCGNLANIYDSSKVNTRTYWDEIISRQDSCGFGSSNAGDSSCGNCDYISGSTGALYEVFLDGQGSRPDFGDNICRNLGCEFQQDLNGDGDSNDDGEVGPFRHGETWCAESSGVSEILIVDGEPSDDEINSSRENLPGSRYFRLVCYNGEVTVESCADFRQEICIESSVETSEGDFRNAACRVNKWQDCTAQDTQRDCVNQNKRDCEWVSGERFDGEIIVKGNVDFEQRRGKCIPKYAPGNDFWNSEGDTGSLCFQASETCVVKFKKSGVDLLTGQNLECEENCECLGSDWLNEKNNICLALGDCGASVNYIGDRGFNNLKDLVTGRDNRPEDENIIEKIF